MGDSKEGLSYLSQPFSKEETIKKRESLLAKSHKLWYRENPIKCVRARGAVMYDEAGTAYLDLINNVAHVGHCHPEVVSACTQQMAELNTNIRFLNDNVVLLSEALLATMPEELDTCFFVNSGSEANDLMIRLSRLYTANTDFITLDQAYHGNTSAVIDISPYKWKSTSQCPDWVHVAPHFDVYRGKFTDKNSPLDADFGALYAEEVNKLVLNIQNKGESQQLARNIVVLKVAESPRLWPNHYNPVRVRRYPHLATLHALHSGLMVCDEVQVGFGRVGKHWWAFQLQGTDFVPDIVTVGKPFGDGFPLAAVVCKREIADRVADAGLGYFNTYGGNPVACAAGLAVLKVLEKEKLLAHATDLGAYVLDKLMELKKKHLCIGDVRGVGLFVGLDIVEDRDTREPGTAMAAHISNTLRLRHHILLSTDGPHENVLKFKPPMVLSYEQVDRFVSALDDVMTSMEDADEAAGDVKSPEQRRVKSTLGRPDFGVEPPKKKAKMR